MKRVKNQVQSADQSWHVVEQDHSRVKPTPQNETVIVNTNISLAHEADRMGEAAIIQAPLERDNKGEPLRGG